MLSPSEAKASCSRSQEEHFGHVRGPAERTNGSNSSGVGLVTNMFSALIFGITPATVGEKLTVDVTQYFLLDIIDDDTRTRRETASVVKNVGITEKEVHAAKACPVLYSP